MKRKKKDESISADQARALDRIARCPHEWVIGIDEVGVGCLAGPVVVAGVAVPKGWWNRDVRDSKATRTKREEVLRSIIVGQGLTYCALTRTSKEIDAEGIKVCVDQLTEGVALYLKRRYPESLVVLDGKPAVAAAYKKDTVMLVAADALVPAVSAASIVAKVTRDAYMVELAKSCPHWGFEQHKGYPTGKHRAAIDKYGICEEHRRSYAPVRSYIDRLEARVGW